MPPKKENPFLHALGTEKMEIGEQVEESVLAALTNLEKAGELPDWLLDYTPATQEEDQHGVDGWFGTDVGRIKVNFKASKKALEIARGRHSGNRGREDIAMVVIHPGSNDREILNKCISAISPFRQRYLQQRQQ